MWRLMTGMPSSSSVCRKKGIVDHFAGNIRLNTSTGSAETYSSAVTTEPSRICSPDTVPSSAVMISLRGAFSRTSPPRASMYRLRGSHSRSDCPPSMKAICSPSSSLRKRFIAVSTTVIESLSGSMKSSAFAIAMKISSLTVSGMPYLSMNSLTLSSSCASMNGWPSSSIGSRPGTIRTLSRSESISVLPRMAAAMLSGAGTPSGKSNEVNSPGSCGMANVMRCAFHCSRSSMPSSWKRFIMFGYAPKKMCRPVSIMSPSASCHADTLPPSTSRASRTTGVWPASARYLAQARPERPPPMTATVFFSPCQAYAAIFSESA
mmetsp:Transcript_44498/g.144624  ORF Transcript_44498/g.144624 Transcript_44498/m.144624 type:complete len:320 (-) Transcript_44498:189-1148(-)